jgi:hypothetical protein
MTIEHRVVVNYPGHDFHKRTGILRGAVDLGEVAGVKIGIVFAVEVDGFEVCFSSDQVRLSIRYTPPG